MAYIDDNNNGLGIGTDPMDEIDKELEELKRSLGEPEQVAKDTRPATADTDKTAVSDKQEHAEEPVHNEVPEAPAGNATEPDDGEKRVSPEPKEEQKPLKPEKKNGRPAHFADKLTSGKKTISPVGAILMVIVSLILVIGLTAGTIYGVFSLINMNNNTGETVATSNGEPVTINDSVMGDIDLTPAKGAEINTYSAENLVTEDNGLPAYYQDGKKISHIGIDLSEYQGEVDFEKAKAAGVEFVMLRIGGRFYGDKGTVYEDGAFDSYYQQAKAAGIKVGAYFFSQAVSAADAVEEAEFVVKKLGGKKLDYPIAFDWENIADDEARTDNVNGSELTTIAEAFCNKVIESGYKAIVYANSAQMFIMYDFETMKDYDFWLADYREFPTMYYKFDMWQYATDGTVDGIEGSVDMNLSFTDFE